MTRRQLEEIIETLIGMLDEADGDENLEASDNGIADEDGLAEQFVGHGRFIYGAAV